MQRVRERNEVMISIQRKDKMDRLVLRIKPKIVSATNIIINPWKPMMVKIFFRLQVGAHPFPLDKVTPFLPISKQTDIGRLELLCVDYI